MPCFDVAPTPSPSEVPAMSHGRQKLVIRLRLRPPCCVFLPSHLLSLFLHLITMPVLEATPRQTSQAVLQPGTVASCQGSTACTTQASKASEASKATHRLMAARDGCALASLLRKKSVRNKHIRKTGRQCTGASSSARLSLGEMPAGTIQEAFQSTGSEGLSGGGDGAGGGGDGLGRSGEDRGRGGGAAGGVRVGALGMLSILTTSSTTIHFVRWPCSLPCKLTGGAISSASASGMAANG